MFFFFLSVTVLCLASFSNTCTWHLLSGSVDLVPSTIYSPFFFLFIYLLLLLFCNCGVLLGAFMARLLERKKYHEVLLHPNHGSTRFIILPPDISLLWVKGFSFAHWSSYVYWWNSTYLFSFFITRKRRNKKKLKRKKAIICTQFCNIV